MKRSTGRCADPDIVNRAVYSVGPNAGNSGLRERVDDVPSLDDVIRGDWATGPTMHGEKRLAGASGPE